MPTPGHLVVQDRYGAAMSDPRDLLDADTLRARGGLKWTGMHADIAAWVAESDLGVAPARRQHQDAVRAIPTHPVSASSSSRATPPV